MTTSSPNIGFYEFNPDSKSGLLVLGQIGENESEVKKIKKQGFEFNFSHTAGYKIPYSIVDHKSKIKCLIDDIDLGVVYSQNNKKFYGISGDKKYTIAKNATGEHFAPPATFSMDLSPTRAHAKQPKIKIIQENQLKSWKRKLKNWKRRLMTYRRQSIP